MNRTRSVGAAAALAVVAVIAAASVGVSAGTSVNDNGPAPLAVKEPARTASIQPNEVAIYPDAIRIGRPSSRPYTTLQCVRAFRVACYTPGEIRQAYDVWPLYEKGITGKGQTIVIVDSFGSPTIRHDLAVFDAAYNLSPPPSLKIIQPAGVVPPFTETSDQVDWAGETTLDVEYAHVLAPGANILLVETPTAEDEGTTGFPQIVAAEKYVIDNHLGDVISQSFGATEETFPTAQSLLALRSAYLEAAEPANDVTVLAASGDSGATDYEYNLSDFFVFPVTSWPDSDPLVTGVGGTQLHLDGVGNRIAPDSVWNETYDTAADGFFYGSTGSPLAGGGGKSVIFERPSFQNAVAKIVGPHRGVPDVSMSAACDGGVITYQSFPGELPGWSPSCGTSEATPLFAGVVALADQLAGHPLGLINPALYALSAAHAPGIVDITKGNNTVSFEQRGIEHTVTGYQAVPGYDLASGVGTVNVAKFVPELVAALGTS